MKLRREAALLKGKAIASLRRAMSAFNAFDEDGRVTTVLLHMQHAFEMLLKAALVQKQVRVFDPRSGEAISFEKCVRLISGEGGLSPEEAGTARAIDALRDVEQHWHGALSEQLLYSHVRGGITLFDDVLKREFSTSLADHLPRRVLPVSVEPPKDLQLLIDDEYSQIKELLKPGLRRVPDAQARLRGLLAMEAHVAENVRVSAKDVQRVQRAIRAGKSREAVFPRLGGIQTETEGEGLLVTVRFSKTEGAPVQFVQADDYEDIAAIREVDLQAKFHWSPTELATKLKLSTAKAKALRWHLGIDQDPGCLHEFVFGSQRLLRFSDNALTKMREALSEVDLDEVWRRYRAQGQ